MSITDLSIARSAARIDLLRLEMSRTALGCYTRVAYGAMIRLLTGGDRAQGDHCLQKTSVAFLISSVSLGID